MAEVRDIDHGAIELLARLRGLDGTTVTVGVHADDAARPHPSGVTVGAVADVLELGDSEQAPRAFVRSTIDDAAGRLGDEAVAAGVRVLEGESANDAFGPMAGDLRDEMRSRAPSRTGTTREAITARVNGEVV